MNVLLTGITGLLGTALVEERPPETVIRGIYLGAYEMRDTPSVQYAVCDVTDDTALHERFGQAPIDWIVHTAGIANTDVCEREPERAYRSNVIGTRNVLHLARSTGARIAYISTNAVFDGSCAPYGETDPPNPINCYGRVKLECERLVQADSQHHLIIRPILLYGLNHPRERECFLFWILNKLGRGEELNIVNDVSENPLLSYQCARFIWALIDRGAAGIYHLAGRNVLSRYEAAMELAEVFSRDRRFIHPVPSSFFKSIAPRPRNTAYSTAKLEAELAEKPLDFRAGLTLLKERMQGCSRPDTLRT